MVHNRFYIFSKDAKSIFYRSDLGESIMWLLKVEGESILPCVRKMLDSVFFFFPDSLHHIASSFQCYSPPSKFLIFLKYIYSIFYDVRLLFLIFKNIFTFIFYIFIFLIFNKYIYILLYVFIV